MGSTGIVRGQNSRILSSLRADARTIVLDCGFSHVEAEWTDEKISFKIPIRPAIRILTFSAILPKVTRLSLPCSAEYSPISYLPEW